MTKRTRFSRSTFWPKRAQLPDEVGSLLDERFRAAVEQFHRAAKILEGRRNLRRPGVVSWRACWR